MQNNSSLTPLAQTIILSAALVVLGGVAGIPFAITEFPLVYPSMLIPFGVCLLIPNMHNLKTSAPTFFSLLFEVAGVWTGCAIAFHAVNGFWDGQGIIMGLIGTAVTTPIICGDVRRRLKETHSLKDKTN